MESHAIILVDTPGAIRLEVLEDVHNIVVQAAPDTINQMLLEHFRQQKMSRDTNNANQASY